MPFLLSLMTQKLQPSHVINVNFPEMCGNFRIIKILMGKSWKTHPIFFRNFQGGELRPISGKLIQAQLPKMDEFSRNRPESFLEIIKSASG